MPSGVYQHKPKTEITKEKLRQANFGQKRSEAAKENMRQAQLNSPNHKGMLGKKHTEETKNKLKEYFTKNPVNYWLGKRRWEDDITKCNLWRGGKSYELYSVDWRISLKRSIRERDKYTCQLCKEPQGDEALSVHHIDYNKHNCDPNNLISLCRLCHSKTNFNRNKWIEYFNNK